MRNLLVCSLGYRTEPKNPKVVYSGGLDDVVSNIYINLPQYRSNIFVQSTGSSEEPPLIFEPKPYVQVNAIPIKKWRGKEEKKNVFNIAFEHHDILNILDYQYTLLNEYVRPMALLIDKKNTVLHCHDWLTGKVLVELKREIHIPTVFSVHMSVKRREDIDYLRFLRICEEKSLIDNGMRGILQGLDNRLFLEAEGCEEADLIHCVSEHVAESVVSAYKVSKEKVVVIPNGVDVKKYRPPEKKDEIDNLMKKYGLRSPFILSTGRFVIEKGHKELIEAFKYFSPKHPEYMLAIFGFRGYTMPELINERDALPEGVKDKVKIFGDDIREEIVPLYQSSDICAFPSHEEAFGIVALEAMSCGKPVVVGDVGGLKEIISDDYNNKIGTRVDGRNPESIAEGLERAHSHKEEWGREARKYIEENYSWKKIAQEYDEKLYSPFF